MCNNDDCEWNEFGECWMEMYPQLECHEMEDANEY